LSLLNSGSVRSQDLNSCSSQTYVHPATGSTSAIDLSICSPNLFLDLEWRVHNDLCGSDHYPLIICFQGNNNSEALPSWKLAKADWASFVDEANNRLSVSHNSIDDYCDTLSIAMETIPKSRKATRNRNTVWFNDECKDAINRRKRALRKVSSLPTVENIEHHKVMRANARRTIRRVR